MKYITQEPNVVLSTSFLLYSSDSAISNRQEPKRCLGRVFHTSLGNIGNNYMLSACHTCNIF